MTAALGTWEDYLRFRDRFAAILDPITHNIEWLDAMVSTGQIIALVEGESAILLSVRTYPTGAKELHAEAATGELKAIEASLIPQFLDFGRSQGCEIAVVQSRPGWVKVMQRHGFEVSQISVRKDL